MAASTGFACIALVIAFCSLTGSADACSLDANVTQSCLDEVINLQLNTPTAESGVNAFCTNVTNLCPSLVDSNNCSCATNGSNERIACLRFIGYRSALNYLCQSSVERAVFLKYRPCITKYTQDLITNCSKNAETCSQWNTAFKCYFDGMGTQCGELVTVVMTQSLLRRSQPQLDNINCVIDTSGYLSTTPTVKPAVCGASAVGLSMELAAAMASILISLTVFATFG